MKNIETQLKRFEERNVRVEADKAWETCKTRRIIIALFIYVFAVLFLVISNVQSPFQNALIPSLAYIFSTLTLPFFKEWWLTNRYKR